MGHWYWGNQGLVFPVHNEGGITFPYPVSRSDRHFDLSKILHMLSSVSSFSCRTTMSKFQLRGSFFGVEVSDSFFSNAEFFFCRNFQVLMIQ